MNEGGRRKLLIAAIVGLSAAIVLLAGMIFFTLQAEKTGPYQVKIQDWREALADYDRYAGSMLIENRPAADTTLEALGRILDRLEKQAGQGVEPRLSVLKRRRVLAQLSPALAGPYREAAERAAAAFPYSGQLAAVAAEAAVMAGGADTARYAELLSGDPAFAVMGLALRVLHGDFASPAQAAAVSGLDRLVKNGLPASDAAGGIAEQAGWAADLALLHVIGGDITGAADRIQTDLVRFGADDAYDRFAAEFLYDFGDPRQSADLFFRLGRGSGGTHGLAMAASACALAGGTAAARNAWTILASPAADGSADNTMVRVRALYNLAASTTVRAERQACLEQLFAALPDAEDGGAARICAEVMYTRLLDQRRAAAILQEALGADTAADPEDFLIDLELTRRRAEAWTPDRSAAETWLLVGRHPHTEQVYRWAAWFFSLMRMRQEEDILLENARQQGFIADWIALHEALNDMHDGSLDAAEKLLRGITAPFWQVYANLGLILEARRENAAALNMYEKAAASIPVPANEASRVQVHIARCMIALGKRDEAARVLHYALDLNPENLAARMELQRVGE